MGDKMKLVPKMYQKDIYHIKYNLLKKKNIEVIIFDIDNTLLKVDELVPSKKLVDFIENLKKDFKIIIASNNTKKRVQLVGDKLKCDYLYSMMKPTKKIKKFLIKKGYHDMKKVMIIGDQIVTDILMGNRLGIYTVMVDPISNNDLKITYFNRFLEKIIMKIMGIKRGEYYEEK